MVLGIDLGNFVFGHNMLKRCTYANQTRKYDLHYRDLEGDIEAEVVIIGGGFSCINTLLDLPEHNERACNH